MRRILDGVELIPGRDHCLYISLRSYLRFLGYHAPDAVLAREWAFYYEGGSKPEEILFSASHAHRYLGLNLIGFIVEDVELEDSDEAWEIARESIDNGVPLVVSVDPYFLSYWPFKNHLLHGVLIYGYEEDSKAWVIDGINAVSYKGPVQVDELKRARASTNPIDVYLPVDNPSPVNNHYLFIEPPSTPDRTADKIIHYIENARLNAFPSLDEVDALRGIRGITRLGHDLAVTSSPSHYTSEILYGLWQMMGRVCTEKGLGVSVFKLAHELFDEPAYLKVTRLAEEARRSWWISANLCLKASKRFDPIILHRLSRRILDIASLEERLFDQLEGISHS